MTAIVVADYDDPDICAMKANGTILESAWLRLGLPYDSYDLNISPDRASCTVGAHTFDLNTFRSAHCVLFRRWRVSPPSPIVRIPEKVEETWRQFSEKEWQAAFHLLFALWFEQRAATTRWSRSPQSSSNKHEIMYHVKDVVRVPPWFVAARPRVDAFKAVTKSVGSDQSVAEGLRTSTILVDEALDGVLELAPVLVQSYIRPKREVRIVYSFGQSAQVLQREGHIGPTDVRLASTEWRRPYHDSELAGEIMAVARILKMEHFTADILIDDRDVRWWIDINPDGLSVACDDEDATLLNALSRSISAMG